MVDSDRCDDFEVQQISRRHFPIGSDIQGLPPCRSGWQIVAQFLFNDNKEPELFRLTKVLIRLSQTTLVLIHTVLIGEGKCHGKSRS